MNRENLDAVLARVGRLSELPDYNVIVSCAVRNCDSDVGRVRDEIFAGRAKGERPSSDPDDGIPWTAVLRHSAFEIVIGELLAPLCR